MLKNAKYIDDNIIITDEVNTHRLGKPAQVGWDCSIKSIEKIDSYGMVLTSKTYAPTTTPLEKTTFKDPTGDEHIGWFIEKGTYIIKLNEGCSFGANDNGLFILRSSLNRSGVSIHSALWDCGYTSKDGDEIFPMSIRMSVENDNGFYLEENARVAQMIVLEGEDTTLYNGQWQGGKTQSKLV